MEEVEVVTFGCRLNSFESEVMRRHARAAGLSGTVVVHTCAVTPRPSARRADRRRLRRSGPTRASS
jgi:threonylcarbamoyladenosine tRNA methylthiotransferase MtaB